MSGNSELEIRSHSAVGSVSAEFAAVVARKVHRCSFGDNRMSEVLEPTTTTQGWAGPRTHEEANCYHQGFLGGLTVFARERGESTLKSQNPLLARLMDEQGFATIETFERLPAITPAGFALTKDELKLCAELPGALVALADFHDSKASMAAAMGYRESTDHHSARAEELKAEAKRIEATW